MEGGARSAKYEYRPNANLVLESDRDRRAAREPSGEAESLAGRLGSSRMGDRVSRARPAELDDKLAKAKAKHERNRADVEADAAAGRRAGRRGKDFLAELAELEGSGYRPKTRETRAVWEQILTFVQRYLGDQPQEILAGAAEEALAIIKGEAPEGAGAGAGAKTAAAAQARVGELLGARLAEDAYARLTGLARGITDFHIGGSSSSGGGAGGSDGAAGGAGAGAGAGGGRLDEDVGVAVVFDDDEDEDGGGGAGFGGEDEYEAEEQAGEDDVDDGDADADADGDGAGAGAGAGSAGAAGSLSGAMATDGGAGEGGAEEEEAASGLIPVHSIDAYWLQRELAKYGAGDSAGEQAEAVMSVLAGGFGPRRAVDVSGMETRLVALLDFDKLDLVKTILRNAGRIFYVTRLRQAQSDAEREAVRAEMAEDLEGGGPDILARLDARLSSEAWAAARTQTVTARVRREARELLAAGSASVLPGGAGAGVGAGESDGADVAVAGAKSVVPGAASSAAAGGVRSLPPILAAAAKLSAAGGAGSGAAGAGAGIGGAPGSRPERTLDLESLTLTAGGHTMSNRRVELPPKSWRAQKKGYEEVHVPPLKARPLEAGEREIPIAELPAWAQPAFKGMAKLNRVQSKLYPTALQSSENMLLCAPTGAGKTNVAMLSIMHEVGLHVRPDGSVDTSAFKIVYIAPMKALVQEVVANLSQRLTEAYGIVVKEMSGDVSLSRAEVAETQIIVTTPEKWDVVTRKAGDRAYTQLVRLIIMDEVHLLHDERGPVLEAIVARTLRQVEATREMVRLVGLSATLPNYADVAAFLRVDPDRGLFFFDNSYRPVPLQQQYIGITEKKAVKRLQLMNDICYEKAEEQAAAGNQVIIFVHTRKETAKTARSLRDTATGKEALSTFLRDDSASREILVAEAEASVKDADLKELLPYGFAIHHAGLVRSDRKLVEDLFADGHVRVLVSTATLAWGVNLPAHAVIIKGTQVYNPEKGRWAELSPLDMTQMLGRAGRPQYDTFGEGVIITSHSELQFYLSLLNQQLPIESQLVARLADNLNAEIVLGSVTNVREAAAWLGYTYLYVRMLQNPSLYGVSAEELARDPLLLQRRTDLAHSAAVLLDRHFLIRYDRKSGAFASTALGRVASHYYITHATVATYNEYLKPTLGDIELFRLFSLSGEFKNVVVRTEEKEELRRLLERVPIPIKESLEEPSAKVNVLLQAYISGLRLDGYALMADMVYVHQSAGRLMRAIFEICLRRGWAALAQRALAAAKMVDYRQWQSASPLRQFKREGAAGAAPGSTAAALPEEVLRRLERKDIPWDRFYDMKPADLGELVRIPKMGRAIHRLIHAIPRVELSARVQPLTRSLLRFDVTLTPDFAYDPAVHGGGEMFWVMVEDADGEAILHHEPFFMKGRAAAAGEDASLTFYVPVSEPLPPQYFVRVVSDRWLQSEALLPISFRHLLLPDKFPPHTELLDLAPLPVSALKNGEFEALYTAGSSAAAAAAGSASGSSAVSPLAALGPAAALTHFNPIQTQAFNALYETDGNVLLAAPSGAGKTLCAEFALLRLFGRDPEARAVYIAPNANACRQRWEEWELKFSRGLGKAVVELTGELAADLKLVERAHIVVATPRQWDSLSRRWRKRRAVTDTALFIFDELETLGSGGPAAATYEIVCSRMRFVALQAAQAGAPPPRLVGLAMSVANARDLGEWLGAAPGAIFSFHPQVRPVPLEIRIQGFDIASFGARLLAMSRPAYAACAAHASAPGRPGLVFVPSRKQAQLTAVDMITYAAADGAADRFRRGRAREEDIAAAAAAAGAKEGSALMTCLRAGVAFYHEGMPQAERDLIARLYSAGAIGVVVAPRTAVGSMGSARWGAHLVVIVGTEGYDGRAGAQRYVDYPVAEVLHMMGRANRAAGSGGAAGAGAADDTARCVLLCAGTRKEYLKRFLYEPLPVESSLHLHLGDHMNAEVGSKVIESKQDALDYLTWTLLYRRLGQNPNFYNLQGASHRHISDFLSELVDTTLASLSTAQCVAVGEDEMSLSPLNLGLIAAYYYVGFASLEVFASSLGAKTKLRGLLEILASASEYDELPLRQGEERVLRDLAVHLPLPVPGATASGAAVGGAGAGADGSAAAPGVNYADPHTKAHILAQAHFSRRPLGPELRTDQARVVEDALSLCHALVDVAAAEGWLKPALGAMELSQMLVQGLWADKDSVLLQVPHVTRDLAAALEAGGSAADASAAGSTSAAAGESEPVESVFDLIAMEDDARAKRLGMSASQLRDVAAFCNRYPNVDVAYDLPAGPVVEAPGESVPFVVNLTREAGTEGMDEGAGIGAVHAPFFPKAKAEGWWLVVGDASKNAILAIKRVTLAAASRVKLDFPAPSEPGEHTLTLFFMCDSYAGCDQEYEFTLSVGRAGDRDAGGDGGAAGMPEDGR